jgi:hypothetical protein
MAQTVPLGTPSPRLAFISPAVARTSDLKLRERRIFGTEH